MAGSERLQAKIINYIMELVGNSMGFGKKNQIGIYNYIQKSPPSMDGPRLWSF
jgi:hypothetical protein